MSIASNISMAFFSDCNTFATPTDSICAKVESFNPQNRAINLTDLLSSLLHRISGKGSREFVYCVVVFQSSPSDSFIVSGVYALRS